MSMTSFQQALCDLIASPRLCHALRAAPDEVLSKYDLSARERARLREAVWQRGMSTSCSLYRANRLTPIYMELNYTCLSLGPQFRALLDEFWDAETYRNAQYPREVERFAAFLGKRIADGVVANPFTAELLEFELALHALRFAPRQRLMHEMAGLPAPEPDMPCRLHPLARLVRFRHDPTALLDAAARGVVAAEKIPPQETLIAVSVANGDVSVIQLPDEICSVLAGDGQLLDPVTPRRAPALADAGLLVPDIPSACAREPASPS
jgi:hypothetical protein